MNSPGTRHGPQDGRGDTLTYPSGSVLLLAGLPGAGKSTLLNRLYGLTGAEHTTARTRDGIQVIDSLQSRNRLTPWLRAVPYPMWRWLVHVLHYTRIAAALRASGPVIVHDSGTRRWVRALLGWYSRRLGREVHLLVLDVAFDVARRGQFARGRTVTWLSFVTHARRWRSLLTACARGPARVVPGAASLILLDRSLARSLSRIDFGGASGHRATRGEDARRCASARIGA